MGIVRYPLYIREQFRLAENEYERIINDIKDSDHITGEQLKELLEVTINMVRWEVLAMLPEEFVPHVNNKLHTDSFGQ